MKEKFFSLQLFADESVIKLTDKNDDYDSNKSKKFIYALSGNDTIWNYAENVTVDGGKGNDFFNINSDKIVALGGEGNDHFYLDPDLVKGGSASIENVTLTGGNGKDTYVFDPCWNQYNASAVITDFTEEDVIVYDGDAGHMNRKFTYSVENGNIVIKNNLLVDSETTTLVEPSTVITLKGIDDISKVANANFYIYNSYCRGSDNPDPFNVTTLGELFETNKNVETLTENDDKYTNQISGVVIRALGGKDSITNYGDKVTIDGGKDNDYIDVKGYKYVSYDYEDGEHKSAVSVGANNLVDGGDGNDEIRSAGEYSSINGGNGNDFIHLGEQVYMPERNTEYEDFPFGGVAYRMDIFSVDCTGEAGIAYFGSHGTVQGGNGNDTIETNVDYSYISGDAGNDYIISGGENTDSSENYKADYGRYNTLLGGAGNDTIENGGGSSTINGGVGNDVISNSGKDVKIFGDTGNDSIENSGSGVTIDGGAGNDKIIHSGDYSTITGGAGNDLVSLDSNYGNNILRYANGNGNNTIYGFGSSDTLQITKGTFTTLTSGKDIILKVGKGSITFKDSLLTPINVKAANGTLTKVSQFNLIENTKAKKFIKGTSGRDSITSSANRVTIDAAAGNDYIESKGDLTSIIGGIGNDNITSDGKNVTINGGAGNDVINTSGSSAKISGGDGTDTISSNGDKVFISGDSGNDSLNINGKDVTISAGDGNDTIENFSKFSTINGGTGNDL